MATKSDDIVSTPPAERHAGDSERGEVRMTFFEHLMELRRRLVISAFAILAMMTLSLVFFKPIWGFMMAPAREVNRYFMEDAELKQTAIDAGLDPSKGVVRMVSNDPLAVTLELCKLAFWLGLVLSSPIVLLQIWRFVAPGLRPNEIRAIRPVLIAGVLCFLFGAFLCYYLVFPISLNFLVWLDIYLGLEPFYSADSFISLLIMFMVIFGAMFEIPVVAAVLAKLGLLKPQWLTKHWRGTVLGCFILGAIISPSNNVFSYLIFAGCLLFLWGASTVLAYALYPKSRETKA